MYRDAVAVKRSFRAPTRCLAAAVAFLGAFPVAAQPIDPCDFCVAIEIKHFWRIKDHPRFQNQRQIARRCTAIEFPIAEFNVVSDGTQVSEFSVQQNVTYGCQSDLTNPRPFFVDAGGHEVTGAEEYGIIEVIAQGASSVRFNYTNPTQHPPAGEMNRRVSIVIEFDGPQGGKVWGSSMQLVVFRPPVVMTHGLWSTQDAFLEMEKDLSTVSNHYPKDLLYRVDYSGSNGRPFAANQREVEFGAISVIEQAVKKRYAVGKVDLVGHSMGGLLGRLFVKGPNYHDEVRRVITCNTPHAGSQMANWLLDEVWDPLGVVCLAIAATGDSCYEGAVCDLNVESDAIHALNAVPSGGDDEEYHALATVLDLATTVPAATITSFAPFNYAKLLIQSLGFCNVPGLVDRIFANDDSDLIVALPSQTGGLDQQVTSLYQDQMHVGSTDNQQVIDAVRELLDEPPDSIRFTTSGYQPAALGYYPTSLCRATSPPPSLGRSQGCPTARHPLPLHSLATSTLAITAPASGTTVASGAGFSVTVAGSADVATILLLLSHRAGEFYLAQQPGPVTTFTVSVPNVLIGGETLVAIGLDGFGQPVASSNPVGITVTVAAQLQALGVDPAEIYLDPGRTRRLTITGGFADGIDRDLSQLAGLAFTFAEGHASKSGTNGVTLDERLDDTVTIAYQGVEAPAVAINPLPEEQPVYPKKPLRRRLRTN